MGLVYLWIWSILSLLKPNYLHSNTESNPVQIIEPTFTKTLCGYFNPVIIRQIILAPV